MEARETKTDVVVVGGGMAGLTAATYLARGGLTVTLFEKAASLGGRASSTNYDGYSFNRGIHALYGGGATEHVLKELGIAYSGKAPKDVHVLHQGKLHLFPTGVLSLLSTGLFNGGEKLELLRFFTQLPGINAQEWANVSIQEWLDRTFRRPTLRQFMAAFAYTNVYSSALDLVSAEVHIKKLQLSFSHPTIYLDDGWQTLIDGLRAAAEKAGARIVSGSRVEAVVHGQEGMVQGVRLHDGGVWQASAVIIAAGPRDAVKLLDEGSYAPLRKIVDAIVPARVACLDVALSRLPDPRHAIVQDMDKPLFFSTQSLYSRVAPEGGALIYSFKQLDPRHSSDPREDEKDLEDLLDTVQPGWREVLVRRSYLPHIEGVSMLPLARDGGYASRPGIRVPGLDNLYLAGDWIGEGFLSDPSLGSAREVAQTLLRVRAGKATVMGETMVK